MNDQELAAEARRVATTLSGSRSDLGRYAAGLLAELADRAERLDGDLDAIRGILAGFNWEHDDHQYALEQIEMIADTGPGHDTALDDLEGTRAAAEGSDD